jgi:hypothetical protein
LPYVDKGFGRVKIEYVCADGSIGVIKPVSASVYNITLTSDGFSITTPLGVPLEGTSLFSKLYQARRIKLEVCVGVAHGRNDGVWILEVLVLDLPAHVLELNGDGGKEGICWSAFRVMPLSYQGMHDGSTDA